MFILLFTYKFTYAAVLYDYVEGLEGMPVDISNGNNNDYSNHIFNIGEEFPTSVGIDTHHVINQVLDLNGDGKLDYIVQVECDNYGSTYDIYT